MKKLLALLLAFVMVFSFAACGGKTENPSDKSTEPSVEETTEPIVQKVTIGDYTVEYDSAILYKPFKSDLNPATLVVYFNYTSNSTEAYLPSTRIYIPAEMNGEKLSGIQYTGDKCPPEYTNYEKTVCEPGATTRCAVIYQIPDTTGTVDVTFMDNFHTIKENMVVSIDLSTLDLVTEPLGVAEN